MKVDAPLAESPGGAGGSRGRTPPSIGGGGSPRGRGRGRGRGAASSTSSSAMMQGIPPEFDALGTHTIKNQFEFFFLFLTFHSFS